MKVILLERVEGRGALGDVVTVKDGFARNFLLPRDKARRATSANLRRSNSTAPPSRPATRRTRPTPARSAPRSTARPMS